jgi:hypothetical protein
MLATTKEDIEASLALLKTEIREIDGKLSGRYNGQGSLRSVAKRILASAERIDRLVAEAEPNPRQSRNLSVEMVY